MLNFITSMNSDLLEQYGYRLLHSFEKFSNTDCRLFVSFEGDMSKINLKFNKIFFVPFVSSQHKNFIKFFGNLYEANGYKVLQNNTVFLGKQFTLIHNFRFDAIKFSFKIFSINLIRKNKNLRDDFIWIDADVVCLNYFSKGDLKQFMPCTSELMSYLGRNKFPQPNPYSECGFLGFNIDHPELNSFLDRMEAIYTTGEIFSYTEWHDSWIWDQVRKQYERSCKFKNISEKFAETDHPFINSGLGRFFDHLKGPERKKLGKSFDSDYANNT